MPTYEYACAKCGQNFDAFQSMLDEPFRECPKHLCRLEKCGHGNVKRLPATGAGPTPKGSASSTTAHPSHPSHHALPPQPPPPPNPHTPPHSDTPPPP